MQAPAAASLSARSRSGQVSSTGERLSAPIAQRSSRSAIAGLRASAGPCEYVPRILPCQAPSVWPSLPMPAVTRASGATSGPRWVRPPWFSKPVSGGSPSRGSMSPRSFADRPGLAPVGVQVEQAQPGALGALGEERAAEQLVTGADRQDRRALVDRPVQAAVGDQPLRRERLRAVLAAADQVDVGGRRHRLVGADLVGLHRDAPQRGPAGQDQQVAPVAVGGQQVGVDPDDPQRALTRPFPPRGLS